MYEIIGRWTGKREKGVWVILHPGPADRLLVQGDQVLDQIGARWRVSRVSTDGHVLLRSVDATLGSPTKDYVSLAP